MKKSIKFMTNIFAIFIVTFEYLLIYFMIKCKIIDLQHLFSLWNILIYFVLIYFFIMGMNILTKGIVIPIKKVGKHMKNIVDGKIVDTKNAKISSKYKEVDDFLDYYSQLMEIIKKNNFDLTSQHSKTEIILEHMADGVIAFSVSQDVIHMNKSAITLLTIPENVDTFDKVKKSVELEDISFDQIMYLPSYKSIEKKIAAGENILKLTFVPFFNEKNVPMGIILIVRNITESTRLDNMRKEFVANVSHEFKTPLTSIKGYSETMMRGDLKQSEIVEFAKVINQEASRMDRLVVDLLQLSKFDYSKASMKKVNFSLSDLANTVSQKMQFVAKQKEHIIVCENAKSTKIYADKDSIEQVIMNIVSNSIKYTPDGGTIKIIVDNDLHNATLRIVDNGIGIPAKELDRIFERFYRVDKARSRQMGGTGLGLSIVKEIVDSTGGNIEMKSEVGVGTETIITLPLAQNN